MFTNEFCFIVSGIIGIIFLIVSFSICFFKRNISKANLFNIFAFYISVVFVIAKLFFPIPTQAEVLVSINAPVHFIPFKEVTDLLSGYKGTSISVGSIITRYIYQYAILTATFIPLGIMLSTRIKSVGKFLSIGFGISFGIELIRYVLNLIVQHPFLNIASEHILFYFLGIIIGYFLYKLCVVLFCKSKPEEDSKHVFAKFLKIDV